MYREVFISLNSFFAEKHKTMSIKKMSAHLKERKEGVVKLSNKWLVRMPNGICNNIITVGWRENKKEAIELYNSLKK